MNPSAPGWIKKHLTYLLNHLSTHPQDERGMYAQLRYSGFIYGTSKSTLSDEESQLLNWTEEEKTKINLFDALACTFYNEKGTTNSEDEDCITAILTFYEAVNYEYKKGGFSFIKESNYDRLEKIIDNRIQTNEPLLKKNFSHLITNALLYIDVLAFKHFINTQTSPYDYAKHMEAVVIQTVWIAISTTQIKDRQEQKKGAYNELLMKLFERSIRYNNWPITNSLDITQVIHDITHPLEKSYILDICALALGSDQEIDSKENLFIEQVCNYLTITPQEKTESLNSIIRFIDIHKENISYLQYSNPIQHFYNQVNNTVSTLILRNKKRLIKEITQSKELAILLTKSTTRELAKDEKKIVRKQLLDICKTVPSLAIFLLPGGSILMPLLVKFIPKLLPSAFNENMED